MSLKGTALVLGEERLPTLWWTVQTGKGPGAAAAAPPPPVSKELGGQLIPTSTFHCSQQTFTEFLWKGQPWC